MRRRCGIVARGRGEREGGGILMICLPMLLFISFVAVESLKDMGYSLSTSLADEI